MKKLICYLVVLIIIITNIGNFAVIAEIDRTNLWNERAEYLSDPDNWSYGGELYVYFPMLSGNLTVLLYTDIAKELTYEVCYSEGGDMIGPEYLFIYGDHGITSPEVDEAIKSCKTGYASAIESRSALRECVQYFGISKAELLQAYQKMKDDPDSIRSVLDFLTDEEYDMAYKSPDGTFGMEGRQKTDWPMYIIDALYLEDDTLAQKLLCKPFAIYIEEYKRVVTDKELLGSYDISVEEVAKLDLTSEEMGVFLSYVRNKITGNDANDGRTNLEKLEYLESVREAQLAAKETGDASVTSVIVLALALPTLCAVVVAKKKRRI